MRIIVSGSIAFDYLMSFPGRFREHILPDQIDHLSVSFLVDSMEKRRGGVAANIAYTLALLGERPLVMATAGRDFAEYRAWLEAQGVDTGAIVEIPDLFTASFFVTTDLDNNQVASFYTGAMALAHQLSIAEHAAGRADLVIISPDDPRAMVKRAQECVALGIPYVYDPSQQIIRLSPEELAAGIAHCFLLIVNEYEFDMIQKKTGWTEAEVLTRAGGLIITMGDRGSNLRIGGEEHQIPIVLPTRIADPTGVGDAFRGGLLRGYSLGLPWDVSGRMGSLAAAYVMDNVGTQSHRYSPAEFAARFRQHFDDEGALDALARGDSSRHDA
ncbi:MAG: carbohydrate kinase family protein [Ardenticatenales bacterium]|nr:carbohydrate kinase family protein [Ardenticatenales bacterium]